MSALVDGVREALVLAVTLLVPLVAAGVVGAVVGGLLSSLLGLGDQTLALVGRAGGVVLALLLTGASMAEAVQTQAQEMWSSLPGWGRAAAGEP